MFTKQFKSPHVKIKQPCGPLNSSCKPILLPCKPISGFNTGKLNLVDDIENYFYNLDIGTINEILNDFTLNNDMTVSGELENGSAFAGISIQAYLEKFWNKDCTRKIFESTHVASTRQSTYRGQKLEQPRQGYCETSRGATLDYVASKIGLTVAEFIEINRNKGITFRRNSTEGKRVWVIYDLKYTKEKNGYNGKEKYITYSDWKLMARLAYAKGTSYSHKDKRAVVSVVMNRALFNPKGTYPGTVCGVIKEKNAFSAVSQSNRKWRESLEPPHINMRTLPEVKEWNLSATAALKASKKPLPELEGATIFHSNSKIGKRPINGQHSPKYWICKFATKIGGHYYFKLLKKN